MQRRTFLATAVATLAASTVLGRAVSAQTKAPNKTRWKVRASEGFDALAFLGPLSGAELYTRYYGADAAAFAARLPEAIRNDIINLASDATNDGYGLLGPNLSVLFSTHGNDATLDTVLTALEARNERVLPSYKASQYWDEKDWGWFDRNAPRLEAIFTAMREAGFAAFRAERTGSDLNTRVADVQRS